MLWLSSHFLRQCWWKECPHAPAATMQRSRVDWHSAHFSVQSIWQMEQFWASFVYLQV